MGILKKIKKAYNEVDKRLGGRLPGAVKPPAPSKPTEIEKPTPVKPTTSDPINKQVSGGMSTKDGYIREDGSKLDVTEENRKKIIDEGRRGGGGGSSRPTTPAPDNPLNLPVQPSNPIVDAITKPKPNINPITNNPQSRITDLKKPTTPKGFYSYDEKTKLYYTSDGKAHALYSNVPEGYRNVDDYNKDVDFYNKQIQNYEKGIQAQKKKYYEQIYTDPKYEGGYQTAKTYNPVYVTPKGQPYDVIPAGSMMLLQRETVGKSGGSKGQNVMTTLSDAEKVQAKIRKATGVSVPTPKQAYNYLFAGADYGTPESYKKVTPVRVLVDVPTSVGKVSQQVFVDAPYAATKYAGYKYAKLWGKSDTEAERFGMITGVGGVVGAGVIGGSVAAFGVGIGATASGMKSIFSKDTTFVQKVIGVAEMTIGSLMASKGLGTLGVKARQGIITILPKGRNTVMTSLIVKEPIKIGESTFTPVSVRSIVKVPPRQMERQSFIRKIIGSNKSQLIDRTKAKTYQVTGEFLVKDDKAIGVIARGLEGSKTRTLYVGFGKEGKSLAEASDNVGNYLLSGLLGKGQGPRVIPKEQLEGLFNAKGVTQRVLRYNFKTGKVSSVAKSMSPSFGVGLTSKSLPTKYEGVEKFIFSGKSGKSANPIAKGDIERGRGIITKEAKKETDEIIKPVKEEEEMVSLYHGTVSDYATAIRKEGFKEGAISWTTDKSFAEGVGANRMFIKTGGKFGKPEVIEIKLKKSEVEKFKQGTQSKFFNEVVVPSERSNIALGVRKADDVINADNSMVSVMKVEELSPQAQASIVSQVLSTVPKTRSPKSIAVKGPKNILNVPSQSDNKIKTSSVQNVILGEKTSEATKMSLIDKVKIENDVLQASKSKQKSASSSSFTEASASDVIQMEAQASAQSSMLGSKLRQKLMHSSLMQNARAARIGRLPKTKSFFIKPKLKLASKKEESDGARQAYDVVVFKGNKEQILAKGLPEGIAKKVGSKAILSSLRASFKLKAKGVTTMEDEDFKLPDVITQSKRDKKRFVQKLNTRFGARSETKEAQIFRKQRRGKMKWL